MSKKAASNRNRHTSRVNNYKQRIINAGSLVVLGGKTYRSIIKPHTEKSANGATWLSWTTCSMVCAQ